MYVAKADKKLLPTSFVQGKIKNIMCVINTVVFICDPNSTRFIFAQNSTYIKDTLVYKGPTLLAAQIVSFVLQCPFS